MNFKLIKFDELMNSLSNYKTLEENLSKIIRDIETEFEFNSMGLFLKQSGSNSFRLKIGRNISHKFMKNKKINQNDQLIKKLINSRLITLENPNEYMFEHNYSHLLIKSVNFRNELLGFYFIDREKDFFSEEDLIKLDIFSNLTALILQIFSQEQELELLREIDPVTELLTQKSFIDHSEHLIRQMKRYNRNLTMVLFKVDRFNELVRTVGKKDAEEIIKKLSNLIKKHVRSTELLGYMSNNSIASIFPETSSTDVKKVVERLHKLVKEIPEIKDWKVRWGITELDNSIINVDDLLRITEKTLYEASRNDRPIMVHQDKGRVIDE